MELTDRLTGVYWFFSIQIVLMLYKLMIFLDSGRGILSNSICLFVAETDLLAKQATEACPFIAYNNTLLEAY